MTEVKRQGSVLAKRVPTDEVYTKYSVQEMDDGLLLIYNASIGKWVSCPTTWVNDIQWDKDE